MADKRDWTFPPEFVWGAATAAYQIEGAAAEDGRSESIWDRFSATPGKVRNGESGTVACDFYHRYPADVALMSQLGLDAFRFSVAWPRVLPDGRGRVNAAGLDFYDRLVDALLEAGIEPMLTLYHWDLPQVLEDEGGWTARSTAEAFAEYAAIVAGRLGDRVKRWITHNEPWVVAWLGYMTGQHAPGRTNLGDAIAAGHHVLLSHGLAADAIRTHAPTAEVGITLNLTHCYPASDSADDVAAARLADARGNRWFLDPLFRAEYPADLLSHWLPEVPPVQDGDMQTIATRLDFLGVNYYARQLVEADGDGQPALIRDPDAAYTDMDWEISPQGLRDLLVRLRDDYLRDHDGQVRDPERLAYLEAHLAAIGQAIDDGVGVNGYFVWSLLDNFEWHYGYRKRFGIVYVDYPTLERVPKSSFYWYRDFIAANKNGADPTGSPTAGVGAEQA
jgi:beta-glucosidase